MQNKGFIRVVAVLLTLICLFYLSFSVVTAIYNNKAKEYAAGDEAKYKHYIDSISTEKVYWWYYTYQQCREMEISLGLDRSGCSGREQRLYCFVLQRIQKDRSECETFGYFQHFPVKR